MKNEFSKTTQPCTIHSVMWRILFMIACAAVWSVTYKINQTLPEFWQVGFPPFVGWISYIIYNKLFG